MVDLGGGVELQVHVGHRVVQRARRVDVEAEVDVRVLAVDHVDLGEAGQLPLAQRVGDELVRRDRVRVLLLARLREGAELALDAADVRLVQVQVLDEVDLVGPAAHAARQVGELAEPEQVVGLEQRQAVLEVEPLAGLDLVADLLQRRCALQDCHGVQRLLSTTTSAMASSSSRRGAPFRLALALLA